MPTTHLTPLLPYPQKRTTCGETVDRYEDALLPCDDIVSSERERNGATMEDGGGDNRVRVSGYELRT